MNLLGYCLSAVPVVAGCGYGVYALTRGGQSVANVTNSSQDRVSEQVTQERGTLEDTGSGSAEITRQEQGREPQGSERRERTRRTSSSKSLSDFSWVLGKETEGKKDLVVQITKGSGIGELENLKFGSGFTVSADGRDLETNHSYILCTVDSRNNKYFLMKQNGVPARYTTMDGESMPPCSWQNSPKENVAKYSIKKWDDSGERTSPLKDTIQIDLSTCTVDVKNWNNKRKLKMTCKKSSNSMLGGRFDNSDIAIELSRSSSKK